MRRELKRLDPITIKNLGPGRHSDGGNLYLLVRPDGRKTWLFRYRDRITGKARDAGLGPLSDVNPTLAREKAHAMRLQLLDGVDPLAAKQERREAERSARAKRVTFGWCLGRFLAMNEAEWKNEKHRAQWRATMDTYASALLPMFVEDVETMHVVKALEPIWTTKTETATRVRGRIESVLSWAKANHLRNGENPARWKGHLDQILPKPTKLKNVQHHPAIPYADMHAFLTDLRERSGLAARVLEWQILTAVRPGEATGTRWDEIDLEAGVWTIPGERMKAGHPHRVPLSEPARVLVSNLPRMGPYCFPGLKANPTISLAAGLNLMKDLRPGFVPHGLRSSFRDWCANTGVPRDVAERCLAHVQKDKVEAAYQRSDMLEPRRRVMEQWAKFVETSPRTGNVSDIRGNPTSRSDGGRTSNRARL
jgi:integrase